MPLLRAADLEDLAAQLLHAWSLPLHAARTVARHLVESSLAGVDSHGIMRLPQYLDQIASGEIGPATHLTTLVDRGALLALDGHRMAGPVAAEAGATLAARRAREHGLALVCVRHIGHAGRIGAYAEQMALEGLLALVFCNGPISGHRVAPPGAREGRLATNPIAYAFPAPEGPVVADFATSAVPEGAVRLLRDRHLAAPPDVLLDAQGLPTTDPGALYADPPGSLLPLGGAARGHKGFALALLVEVLAGTLAGDSALDGTLAGNNLTFLGIDVGATPAADTFPALVAELLAYIRSARPIAPATPVLVPGEKERAARAARLQSGVPVDQFTWEQIAERARLVGYRHGLLP